MRAGNCLLGLGEHWEGWGKGREGNGGKEESLTGPSGQGTGMSVSLPF